MTQGEILLINEDNFKLYSQVSRNVGVDKCYPFLQLAQSFHIEPILGTALLEELQEQIADNEITELNKALLIKIAPALAAFTDFIAARGLAYTITQKGITKEASENSSSLDEKELGYYIGGLREIADKQTEILIKYLCRCQDSYPLWRPEDDCLCSKYAETTGSTKKEYMNVIYFPNKPHKGCGCKDL